MLPELQAKLLTYKAYRLGREIAIRGDASDAIALVRRCLAELEQLPADTCILRRKLFYTLILAESHRADDPLPFREQAAGLGAQLEQLGSPNPFTLYMRVVASTVRPMTTGNLGDFQVNQKPLIQDHTTLTDDYGAVTHIDLAQSAIKLDDRDLAMNDELVRMSLREIVQHHGLAQTK